MPIILDPDQARAAGAAAVLADGATTVKDSTALASALAVLRQAVRVPAPSG